jgi:hypothetical protein
MLANPIHDRYRIIPMRTVGRAYTMMKPAMPPYGALARQPQSAIASHGSWHIASIYWQSARMQRRVSALPTISHLQPKPGSYRPAGRGGVLVQPTVGQFAAKPR